MTKTKSDVGIFTHWFSETLPADNRNLENIPPAQLNSFLRSFYRTVKKLNGEEYEPDSLCSIKNSLDRYLNEKGYWVSICRGEEFKTSRDVLSAKEFKKRRERQRRSLPRTKRYLIEIVLLTFVYKKYNCLPKTIFHLPQTCILHIFMSCW